MRTRIGLCVAGGFVRAVAVGRGGVTWRGEVPSADDIAAGVRAALASRPSVRNPSTIVALGREYVRVKRLHGLEHVAAVATIAEAARSNARRFFIGFEADGHVAAAQKGADGAWYAAYFDSAAVAAVNSACASSGVALQRIVVATSVLPTALRVDRSTSDSLGGDPFGDAVGAAWTAWDGPLTLPSLRRTAASERAQQLTTWGLTAVAVLALLGVVVAPIVPAERARRSAEGELAAARDALRPVVTAMANLNRVSRELDALAHFAGSRRSMLDVLAAVTRELPDSSALLSFKADTAVVTIVALARSGPDVVERLTAVPMLEPAQILGPFTRERIGGADLERLAARARLKPAAITDVAPARDR